MVAVEVHHSLVEHSRQALERWRLGILAEGSITLLEGNALEGELQGYATLRARFAHIYRYPFVLARQLSLGIPPM